jgi:hypothetical protein
MRPPALVEIDWRPNPRTLRRFGFIAFGVFGAIAWSMWRRGSPPAASGAGLVASFALLSAIAQPRWNRALYVGLTLLSYPIAWCVAWLTLLTLFFLIITPISLVYRLFVRKHASRGSAWKNSYFRQF